MMVTNSIAQAASSQPIYELNLFRSDAANGLSSIYNYYRSLSPILDVSGGRFLSVPLFVQDGLIENSALPSTVTNLEYNYITVTEYPNNVAFETIAGLPEVIQLEQELNSAFSARTQVLARSGIDDFSAFLPILDTASVPFGSVPFRPQPPAFFLFNALSLEPGGEPTLINYLSQSTLLILEENTRITDPFIPLEVRRGDFPFSTFVFLEWESPTTFDNIHESPNFLNNVVPIRNSVLANFIEANVVVTQDPLAVTTPDPSFVVSLILLGVCSALTKLKP